MPPTERKGRVHRVHTSTVTVAVLTECQTKQITVELDDSDLSVIWFSGTGSGGQHRNKHQNSCRLTHIPSGTTATAQHRSRKQSYRHAFDELFDRINKCASASQHSATANIRKQQTGSGMRADKIRTYRFQDNQVGDHITGKTASTKQVMKGRIDLLW